MANSSSDNAGFLTKPAAVNPTNKGKSYFDYDYIVVGGGIAGVTCVEELARCPLGKSLLVSDSPIVQKAANVTRVTRNLDEFLVVERTLDSIASLNKSVTTLHDSMDHLDVERRILYTKKGKQITYKYICICTGASPTMAKFEQLSEFDLEGYVYTLRDELSIHEFSGVVAKAKRGLVIGNGGIATEFVFEVQNIELIWAVKDKSISKHYLDSGAAEFLLKSRGYVPNAAENAEAEATATVDPIDDSVQSGSNAQATDSSTTQDLTTVSCSPQNRVDAQLRVVPSKTDSDFECEEKIAKRVTEYEVMYHSWPSTSVEPFGSALGPDWHSGQRFRGVEKDKKVTVVYETEIKRIYEPLLDMEEIMEKFGLQIRDESLRYCTYVELTNGQHFGVDFILSATGTKPNCENFAGAKDLDEGIFVDHKMRTSLDNVYAAGDVVAPRWKRAETWFPMRLWTQARASGRAAAEAMRDRLQEVMGDGNIHEEIRPTEAELIAGLDFPPQFSFSFETFAHSTKFFGFKVVLLGLFNGQGLKPNEQTIKLRFTIGEEYVKLILVKHRVRGAVLIGDTGLEEVIENLILNGTDVSVIEDDILNPALDLEDYFD